LAQLGHDNVCRVHDDVNRLWQAAVRRSLSAGRPVRRLPVVWRRAWAPLRAHSPV